MERKLLTLTVIILLGVLLLGLTRFISGPEDNWICQKGEWIKHGKPSSPKPTTLCPQQGPVSDTCQLLIDKKTKQVGCYGCVGNKCNVPPSGEWVKYNPEISKPAIPYACYTNKSGCALAQ